MALVGFLILEKISGAFISDLAPPSLGKSRLSLEMSPAVSRPVATQPGQACSLRVPAPDAFGLWANWPRLGLGPLSVGHLSQTIGDIGLEPNAMIADAPIEPVTGETTLGPSSTAIIHFPQSYPASLGVGLELDAKIVDASLGEKNVEAPLGPDTGECPKGTTAQVLLSVRAPPTSYSLGPPLATFFPALNAIGEDSELITKLVGGPQGQRSGNTSMEPNNLSSLPSSGTPRSPTPGVDTLLGQFVGDDNSGPLGRLAAHHSDQLRPESPPPYFHPVGR
uniref:Uncharacterized protein n=1 Tax=Ananas comosus var. bracteatus TaxID=296719 RepID=A0A6V7Q726_ANACO|nr:unnamed protein product [Ananas comosus var. bracteatus]